MFKDKMITTATPERVYVLCSYLLKGPQNSKKIKDQMEPEYLAQTNGYYDSYKTAAIELGLVAEEDNFLTLLVAPDVLKDMDHMRDFINNEIGTAALLRDGIFFKVTEEIFKMDDEILKNGKTLSEIAPALSNVINMHLIAESMRAWRFWALYLGLGNLYGKNGMNFLPNSYIFINSLIRQSSLKLNESYSISEFLNELSPSINMLGIDFRQKYLNYGVSNGLRTLDFLGKIELQNVLDEKDIWSIYEIEGNMIKDTVTGIKILKKE